MWAMRLAFDLRNQRTTTIGKVSGIKCNKHGSYGPVDDRIAPHDELEYPEILC